MSVMNDHPAAGAAVELPDSQCSVVMESTIPPDMSIAEYRAMRAEREGAPAHVVRGWLAAHHLTMLNSAVNTVLRSAAIR